MASEAAIRPIEILLVEDNPGDVELTREALVDAKVINQLHVVCDGEEALAFVHRHGNFSAAPRPDLILLDLNLPRKSGQQVLRELKEDVVFRRIPVVILTTSSAERDIALSYNLHANCYVTKPLDFAQFIQVIKVIENFWFSVVQLPRD